MESDEEVPELIGQQTEPSRVPLTIICGFLGAGKSTLLQRILTERHGYRIAVIMNEFGDTADIEAKVVTLSSPDDPEVERSEFLELANGCLCCSIKDSGVAAIENLMQRKGAFDHILLETTGLADPGPIAAMFWQNEEFSTGLGRDITLDGVICVVDAVFCRQQMQEDRAANGIGESLRQIAGSDIILLNKVDLVPATEVSFTEELLHDVNPTAPVYKTIRGQLELKHIMGINAYASVPRFQLGAHVLNMGHQQPHSNDHDGHAHPNDATHYEMRGISSLQVSCPVLTSVRLDNLDEWIRTVLWENRLPGHTEELDVQVLRCKGLFTMESGEQYILQGVRSMYEISKVETQDVVGVPEPGKLVLIGKGLDDTVRRSLENMLN